MSQAKKKFIMAHLEKAYEDHKKAIDANDRGTASECRIKILDLKDQLERLSIEDPVSDTTAVQASEVLTAAAGHLQDRAVTYDNLEGERSMAETVALFNTFTGHKLTESEGWRFMVFLKLVRSKQGKFKADNHEDAVAYEALAAEALQKEKYCG